MPTVMATLSSILIHLGINPWIPISKDGVEDMASKKISIVDLRKIHLIRTHRLIIKNLSQMGTHPPPILTVYQMMNGNGMMTGLV